MQKIIITLVLLLQITAINAQKRIVKPEYGLAAFYNFQSNGIGGDVRALLPLYKNFFLTPHLSYYPKFNDVHEAYLGLDLDYVFRYEKKFSPYLFISANYNNWINNTDFNNPKATKNNFAPEAGAGILFNLGCINPFVEYRFDAKWKENFLGIGVLLSYGDCFKIRGYDCPEFK